MLVERLQHLLLLLVIITRVQVLRLVLLVKMILRFNAISRVLSVVVQLDLHVGEVRLVVAVNR